MLYSLLGETRTVSVIGMCKNAGKTTALNAFIAACNAENDVLGLTSIGRDGERSDVVTNTKKPEIYVQRDTIIATAEMLLSEGDISREILASTQVSTPLGNIVIVKARSAGFVQLGGPSMTAELMGIRDELFGLGCSRVFIDGAISRKSLGTPQLADGVILCSGASYNPDIRMTVDDTAYIASLFSLPVYVPGCRIDAERKFTAISGDHAASADSVSELQGFIKANGADALFVNGAFTDKTAEELYSIGRLLANSYIIAMDASRLLLCSAAYNKLMKLTSGMHVLKGTRLLAVTVNPFSAYGNHYDRAAFKEKTALAFAKTGLQVPVIDVTEV